MEGQGQKCFAVQEYLYIFIVEKVLQANEWSGSNFKSQKILFVSVSRNLFELTVFVIIMYHALDVMINIRQQNEFCKRYRTVFQLIEEFICLTGNIQTELRKYLRCTEIK